MSIYTTKDYCISRSKDLGCDEFKGLFTVKCPPYYRKILRFICAPVCPEGYSDNGPLCYKPVFKSLPNRINIIFNDLFV